MLKIILNVQCDSDMKITNIVLANHTIIILKTKCKNNRYKVYSIFPQAEDIFYVLKSVNGKTLYPVTIEATMAISKKFLGMQMGKNQRNLLHNFGQL